MKLTLSKSVVGLLLATGAVAGTAMTYNDIEVLSSSKVTLNGYSMGTSAYLYWDIGNDSQMMAQIFRKTEADGRFQGIASVNSQQEYYDYDGWSGDTTPPDDPKIDYASVSGSYLYVDIPYMKDNTNPIWYKVMAFLSTNAYESNEIEVDAPESGFAGYSYVLSNTLSGEPDNVIDEYVSPGNSLSIYYSGQKYLKIKAIDYNGNASNTVYYDISNQSNIISITGNPTIWSNSATLNIKSNSSDFVIKSISVERPHYDNAYTSGTPSYNILNNGEHKITVTSTTGMKITETVNVTKIDKFTPTIYSSSLSTTAWTNGNVGITLVAHDNGAVDVSGIKNFKLPNNKTDNGKSTTYTDAQGKKQVGKTITYNVSANGTYTFYAYDQAGNSVSRNVTVSKIDKTLPSLSTSGNPTAWTNKDATISVTGSDSQSGVKSITKPDGTVVNGSSTSYTVTANGNYVVKITDNAGNVASFTQSVTKIDKTKPTISVTGNPTAWTKNNVTLTITGGDTQSGVKSITLPDGTIVTGSSTTYTVTANGNYTFKVTDNVGNETTQTVSVTKIDKTNPTATVTGNPTSWTKNNATLTIAGADSQSGVKSITKPDGTVVNGSSTTYAVSANGTYKFLITDNAGNVLTHNVSVTKIDTTNPTATVTGNPTAWTKNNATLTITGADSQSGVKSITKPDGTVVTGTSTTYAVSANGTYKFLITDNAGNVLTHNVSVTKIDKTAPTISVTGNPTSWTKNNVTLTITGSDSGSGVKQITKPDGTVVTGSSTTYTVTANGNYVFKVLDHAGNETTQTVSVTKIDKTNPTATVTGNPTSWTKNNATLTITGADSQSGVKSITKPDGTVVTGSSTTYAVSANGTYKFLITDNAGNVLTHNVSVTKIDKTNPTATVTGNPTAWTKNNATLTITGADSGSGVKQITKPDGTIVTGSSTTYTVTANGNYVFKITDNVGNEISQTVNVSKIDKTAPTISVSGNPTAWTKNNVTLAITGADSQSGVKQITKPDGTVVTGSSTTYTVSANGNYVFKVLDNAGNEISHTVSVTKIDKTNPTATVSGNPTAWTKNNATLTITGADSQSGVKSITKPDGTVVAGTSTTYAVSANGNYVFKILDNAGNEISQTVSVTKIDKTNPTISVSGNPTAWTKNNVTLTITGGDSASGVKQITLPNGQVVTGSSTTYTVTANGNYTFKVTDNAGNEVTQTVNVSKIDKTNPTATVTGNPTAWTKNNATLTITASDNQSGVKQIELPNGQVVTGSSTTYTVTANGNYTFKITDNIGNVLTQTVSVTKIDKTNPTATVTGNPTSWTKNNATLTITGADSQSGIKQIEKPDGTIVTGTSTTYTVSANGNYTFKITDNVGNVLTQTVSVTKIDKTNPTISVSGNPTAWTKNNITLTVTGADSQSGVKQITKPDGTVVTGSSTTYTVSANGNYVFKVLDNAGNEISHTVSVTKIDKTNPTATVTGNPTSWTKNNATLTITGADSQSGVKQIEKPDGTIVTGTSTTYTVSANGNYTFKITDNVGNVLTQTVSVTKIDKTAPTISVTGNPTAWTKNDVTLTIKGSDSASGVKQITKPDGTIVTGSSTTYTVSANGNYTFKVTDNAGNEISHTVSVSKIDKTAPTYTSTEIKNITTDGYDIYVYGVSDSQSGIKVVRFPTWTDANGQDDLAKDWNSDSNTSVKGENLGSGTYKFRVNRSEHNNEFGNYITHIYMYDNVGNFVAKGVNYNLKDITKPTMSITGNPTSWTKNNVTLTINASDYGTGVKSITLPNGSVVTGSSTTYTVTANGNYTFKVTDNAGNETTQTVSVTKIDKTNPTATVTGNPTTWTKNNATLTITGADSGSGVKQIEKPDGTIVTGTSTTYTVTANGNYTFKITDNVGNVLNQTVSVTKIDKTNPTISVTGNPTAWTKNNVTLTITGGDSASGVKQITLPNGTVVTGSSTSYTVTANGNYTFKVTDNAGNETSQTVSVTKIDKTAPTVNITGNPTSWTKNNATLTITGTDSQSGVKQIELPNGQVVTGTSTTYTVSINNSYVFKVTDNAGNVTTQTVNVTKIDKTAPAITFTANKNSESSATLSVTYSDTQSGIQSLVRPNGTTRPISTLTNTVTETETITQNSLILVSAVDNVGNKSSKSIDLLTLFADTTSSGVSRIEYKLTGATVKDWTAYTAPFYVTNEGVTTITARVYDKAGNISSEKTSTVRIDKTKPTNNSILIEIK